MDLYGRFRDGEDGILYVTYSNVDSFWVIFEYFFVIFLGMIEELIVIYGSYVIYD